MGQDLGAPGRQGFAEGAEIKNFVGTARDDGLVDRPGGLRGYSEAVARKVWTAEELEQLTPPEQDALFSASVVTDLDQVPAAFLERIRARAEQRLVPGDTPPQ
jgi:hypothetical protein